MTRRRSPIHHKVHSHKRRGKQVGAFWRGRGTREQIQRQPRLVGKKKEYVPYPTPDSSIQVYLKGAEGSFVDRSIADYVNRINDAGLETVASCSGLRRDHPGKESTYTKGKGATGAYLSVELPKDVAVWTAWGDIHDLDPRQIKNKQYIDELLEAGNRAGWLAETDKYLMFIPVVYFTIPITGSPEDDAKALRHPDVVSTEAEVDRIMADPTHKAQVFINTIEVRNKAWKKAYALHGGDKPKSDAEVDRYWKRLTKELVKIAPKLEELREK